VAVSFTLIREDAGDGFRKRAISLDAFDPGARVDLVARLIRRYEDKNAPYVSPEVLRWAMATYALRA
jgi:hypothetical protein